MRVVVSVDISKLVHESLDAREICADVRKAVERYLDDTMSDLRDASVNDDMKVEMLRIVEELELVKDSLQARVWGKFSKSTRQNLGSGDN